MRGRSPHSKQRGPERARVLVQRRLKRARVLLGVTLSLALIAWLLWKVDLPRLGAQLAGTQWGWLTLAALFGLAGLWVRAWRWRCLFPVNSRPPALVPAMMIGYMVNNLLPLRAGELVRVYVVARRWRGRFWTVAATLIVERVLDSVCIVLILAGLVFLIDVPRAIQVGAGVLLLIDVVGIAALTAITLAPAPCRRLIARLARRWPALRERALGGFETFLHGLDGVRALRHLPTLVLSTALVWVMPAAAAWTGLRAARLDLPPLAGWVVLAFVGLAVSIPSAPGYLGVFHFAAVMALRPFGVPDTTALGYAIVFHASQFVPVTAVGWVYLLREQMTLGEAAHVTVKETAPPSR